MEMAAFTKKKGSKCIMYSVFCKSAEMDGDRTAYSILSLIDIVRTGKNLGLEGQAFSRVNVLEYFLLSSTLSFSKQERK